MAAAAVTALPEGPEWLYELKLDGSPYSATVTHATLRTRIERLALKSLGARDNAKTAGLRWFRDNAAVEPRN